MKKISSPNREVPAMSNVLPWLCLASPEWLLCKDGSLLSGFTYSGADIDNLEEDSFNRTLDAMKAAIENLDHRFYMWWVVDKRRDAQYPSDVFPDAASQSINDKIASGYENGEVFTLTFRVYIQFTGETGLYAFMESVRQKVSDDGKSMVAAFLESLSPNATGNGAVLHDARQLDANLTQAEEGVRKFLDATEGMKFQRLTGWGLENALIQSANITLPATTQYQPPVGSLLDGYASLSDIQFGREVIGVEGPNKSVLVANLTLKNYAKNTARREVEQIIALPLEFRVTHVVRCLGKEMGQKVIGEATRYYEMTQTSFIQRAISKLTGNSPTPSPGKEELYLECLEAQGRMLTHGLGWVQHAMTISLIAQDLKSLEKQVTEVSRALNGVAFIRERVGLKASFEALIPGQWTAQKRLQVINTEVCSDSLPLTTIYSGEEVSPYMSDLYNKPMPAMMATRTRYGTSYNFNPHCGQLGHTLVVMPSGNGKTTFVNYCLAQFRRYPDAQVVIFDRDWSCRILTGLVGGTHIDVQSKAVKLNPMAAVKEGSMGRLWAREFIIRLVQEGGYEPTPEDRNSIDTTLLNLSQLDGAVSLSKVAVLLSKNLRESMQEWLGSGPYGMFDSEVDDLSISSWTAIEMKQFMSVDRLARAFLDHCFRVLGKKLGGKPTFIYLEEASFLLNNATFLGALDDWLKTFRKLNAFVWMTIQSPQSISGVSDEKIKATLTDNIPNLILGYNQKLENHRVLYKSMFALTDEQVDLLGQLKAKRDYLQISDGFCRIMRTNFTHDVLAYLRSETQYQELFTSAQNSGHADWRERYIQQALKRG